MQDFIKQPKLASKQVKAAVIAKQTGWLTKNRFWNLVFLVAVPAQIFLAAIMWSGWMLLLPLATTIFIFGFAPVDKSAVDNREPQAMRAVKYAGYIWFFTIIAFILAASKILSLFGLELGQFGFGEVVFFIFLIPVSILCYANIPLASCFEAKNPSKIRHSGFLLSSCDGRTSLGNRANNNRSLF